MTSGLHQVGTTGPAAARVGAARVMFGTTSWADRSLVQAGTFYPRKSMSARERLAFYAAQFPLAEIATTFRFPPTAELSAQWAERTPEDFTFDIRVWSLLSGAPTLPDSLWPDLQSAVSARHHDSRRLYASHLAEDVLEECWDRFLHALEPLRQAGKLGALVMQYPGWFSPRPESWAELALLSRRIQDLGRDYKVAVELRSPKWLAGDDREPELEWLEQHGLAYVCVDGPGDGPRAPVGMVAATADVAVVRFIGRRQVGDEPWTSPYRYSQEELEGWVARLHALAGSCREVHVLMDNCWGADAVDNARQLFALLGGDLDHRAVVTDHAPSRLPPDKQVDGGHGHPALITQQVLIE